MCSHIITRETILVGSVKISSWDEINLIQRFNDILAVFIFKHKEGLDFFGRRLIEMVEFIHKLKN